MELSVMVKTHYDETFSLPSNRHIKCKFLFALLQVFVCASVTMQRSAFFY